MAKKKAAGAAAIAVVNEPKINKSEAVRGYLSDNPSAKPKEAAAALTGQLGVTISPAFVSQIKMKMKGGTNGAAAPAGKKAKGGSSGAIETIQAAAAFIKAVGSVDEAQKILAAIGSAKIPF